MDVILILNVGVGGGIGALLRYMVSGIFPLWKNIPIGTLLVNFIGTTILSMITYSSNSFSHFVAAGILGGFTTFSTFSYETFKLFEIGQKRISVLNIILSLTLCWVGIIVGKYIINLIEFLI